MTYRGEPLAEQELSKQWFGVILFLNFLSLFVYFFQGFVLKILDSRSSIRYWGYNHVQSRLCPRRVYGSVRTVKVKIAQSCVELFVTPGIIQSMEFSRPEHWSGQPFPSPGDLPNPGMEPRSPALQADSLPAEPQGKPLVQWGKRQKKMLFFFGGLRLGWAVGASGTNRSAVVSAVGAASSSFWRWRWAPFLKERQEEVGSLLSRGGSTRGGHKRDHMCSWALPRL